MRLSIYDLRFIILGWRIRKFWVFERKDGIFNTVSNKSQEEKAKKLATERALDKHKFFVFGLTIATTLY